MTRRFGLFVGAAFAVTWTSWWLLVRFAVARAAVYGQLPFMMLYIAGGLGPTIAAYVVVVATRARDPLAEFHRRLLRRRLAGRWYLIAVGLPIGLATAPFAAARWLAPSSFGTLAVKPWYMFGPLFALMIAGGGLEELGWRGVAQPELERRLARPTAALIVGAIWAAWHVPLFFLPGVSQYGTSFPMFAVGVIGNALILAWLYGHTRSVMLCVIYHAAWNAILAQGVAIPRGRASLRCSAPRSTWSLGRCCCCRMR